MRFYTTNLRDDPGIDIPNADIVKTFWEDTRNQELWGHGILLERLLRGWLGENIGGWDADAATLGQFDRLLNDVLAAAPR